MSIRNSEAGEFKPLGGLEKLRKLGGVDNAEIEGGVKAYLEYKSETEGQNADLKASNPKDIVGVMKAPITTVPFNVMLEVGVAMLEGGCKYGRHNYRKAGVRASVYIDAVVGRHIGGWWEGEDLDPESGLSHITKAIAGLVVLRDAMMNNKWADDRPIKVVGRNWVQDLNEKAKAIIHKYPDPKQPFTQVDEVRDTHA